MANERETDRDLSDIPIEQVDTLTVSEAKKFVPNDISLAGSSDTTTLLDAEEYRLK